MSDYQTDWTVDQIVANFRRDDYVDAEWSPNTPVTYGFATSISAYRTSYGPERIGFSPFTADQQQAAIAALALWTDVANLVISPATDGNDSNIRFANTTTGAEVAEAFIPGISGYYSGDIWVNPNYGPNQSPGLLGRYGFIALLHEIGHALGLPHPGDYNDDGSTAITYQNSALYKEDTQQYTVMSYFTASHTGADYDGYYPSTPQLDDIAAIQYIYGANVATRTGDTVYGFNTNISGRPEFDFTIDTHPIVTIWDGGGNDTIDLSGSGDDASLNLNAGTFSNAMGLTDNIAIAYGTVIEDAIGGSGSDTILGNSADNLLAGDAGNDALSGGGGLDRALYSGARAGYTITIGAGSTTISGPDGTDTLSQIEQAVFTDQIVSLGLVAPRDFNGEGDSDILFQSPDGTVGSWFMNGGSVASSATFAQMSAGWSIKGVSDFDGDGKSDLLFQGPGGAVGLWLINGGSFMPATVGSGGTSTIKGIGDFNGDTKTDILWQNADNTFGMWFLNGSTVISGATVTAPGAGWSEVGVGDFNGDGKSDILWQNSDTTLGMWMMNGTTIGTPATVGKPGAGSTIAGIGDFNGDGKSDIMFQNADNSIGVWFMNGGSVSSGASVVAPGTGWSVSGIGDYNGDFKSDILWRNTDGTVGMWMMNGGSILAPATVGVSAWGIVAATS